MTGPGNRDSNVADCILEDEVPPDNPRDEFAKSCIGVGVGGTGGGDHRSKFRVAKSGQSAGHRHQKKGDNDRRAGAGIVGCACYSAADARKDSRADASPNPESGELNWPERALELPIGIGGFTEELREGFASEK